MQTMQEKVNKRVFIDAARPMRDAPHLASVCADCGCGSAIFCDADLAIFGDAGSAIFDDAGCGCGSDFGPSIH